MDLAITDVTRFLQVYAPAELARLVAAWPGARAILRPDGAVLGGEDERPVREAVEAMLARIGSTSRQAVRKSGEILRAARRLETVGAILAACSSGAVVGSPLISSAPWLPVVLGGFALLATLVPIVVNWLRGSPTGGNIAEKAVELRELVWEAELLLAEIRRGGDGADWKRALDDANKIGRRAYTALHELGIHAAIKPV
jgi:hypothetical protein